MITYLDDTQVTWAGYQILKIQNQTVIAYEPAIKKSVINNEPNNRADNWVKTQ